MNLINLKDYFSEQILASNGRLTYILEDRTDTTKPIRVVVEEHTGSLEELLVILKNCQFLNKVDAEILTPRFRKE
jgi:hypothetical protein